MLPTDRTTIGPLTASKPTKIPEADTPNAAKTIGPTQQRLARIADTTDTTATVADRDDVVSRTEMPTFSAPEDL